MTWIAEIKGRWARATRSPPDCTSAPTDIARLVTELEEAVELIDALTDAEPCDYDSRGYCTAHALEGPDCANERALVWLERAAGR